MANSLILYPLLTTAMFYLGSMAKITKPIWSRYPKKFEDFMLCSACSGFWYGIVVSLIFGCFFDWTFLSLDGRTWYTTIIVGLCSTIWTPVIARLQLSALQDIEIEN